MHGEDVWPCVGIRPRVESTYWEDFTSTSSRAGSHLVCDFADPPSASLFPGYTGPVGGDFAELLLVWDSPVG